MLGAQAVATAPAFATPAPRAAGLPTVTAKVAPGTAAALDAAAALEAAAAVARQSTPSPDHTGPVRPVAPPAFSSSGAGDDNDAHIGSTIGDRYVVEAVVGEGGMGKVYRARHKVIDKPVAIKILHAELAKDKEAVGRFVREAKAASSIGNDHIVDISDFGDLPDGCTYFVMEYLDGKSLGDMIEEQGSLPVPLIVDVAVQLCDGLQAAHEKDIIHRDLKPDNVTLIKRSNRENFCKILDFGIAKVSGSQTTEKLTMAGAVFGTPHYMSPEQAAGAAVDHRTDIYSLGIMLYEMASGQLPFNADNFMGILTQHMYKAPVPIRALAHAPQCPAGLEALILKCLSKKPEGRYQSMTALAADLRKFAENGTPDAVAELMSLSGKFHVPADYFEGQAAAPVGPRRSSGALVGGVAAAAAVLLGVGAYFLVQGTPPPAAAPAAPTVVAAGPPPLPDPEERFATPTAAPVEGKEPVVVVPSPVDAKGYVDGEELELPGIVQVPKDGTVILLVKRPGYLDKEVELRPGDKRKEVVLVPAPSTGAKPAPVPSSKATAPPPTPPPKPPPPPGDVQNPWGTDG